ARRTPESEGVLRDPEQREPIRHPVPDPDGEESRDAREENRAVRRHVGAARGDSLVARARLSMSGFRLIFPAPTGRHSLRLDYLLNSATLPHPVEGVLHIVVR